MVTDINIDFQILQTNDPKVIVIVDTSDWGHIESKPSIIELTLPGEERKIVHYFEKHKVNVFNSVTLQQGCHTCPENSYVDLPDGIYHVTVKGSPDTFNLTRQFLKTDKTQLEIDKFIVALDLNCSSFSNEIVDKIQKITILMEAAESNTRLGNYYEAQSLLFKVQKLVNKLKGCKACV